MAHVEVEPIHPDKITIHSEWREKELVRQIPGSRWDAEARVWTAPLSWATCMAIRGIFQTDMTMGDNLKAWALSERANRVDPANFYRTALEVEGSAPEASRLHQFQRATVNFGYVAGSFLNANEMGCGKTVETLSLMQVHHLEDKSALPAVVICPNSVTRVWEREALTWFPEANVYVATGGAAKRRKQLAAAAEDPDALVVINIEAVRLHSRQAPYGSIRLKKCTECGGKETSLAEKSCESHPRELNQIPFKTVVVDEAHRIKDPKAKQTRAIWAVSGGDYVLHRYALTGTPVANNVGDLWSVMRMVSPIEFPAKSKFLDRYAQLSWNSFGGMDITGVNPANSEELFSIINPRMRRVLKAVVLPQLPPKVRSVRYAAMAPKQVKAYRELAEDLVTKLDDGSYVLATNNLVANTRLMQFSSASIEMDEDGQAQLCEPSSKLDVLDEILMDLGTKQVAVCAESSQLIDLAAARLEKQGITFRKITGAVPETQRAANLEDFQAGHARVMLFTVKAGGVGLTMTAADTIVFLQRSWSMLENRQAEDRVHRVGSEIHASVQIVDIVAPDTIEESQIEKLTEKAERLEEITRDRVALAAAGLEPDPALGFAEAALMSERLAIYAGDDE